MFSLRALSSHIQISDSINNMNL